MISVAIVITRELCPCPRRPLSHPVTHSRQLLFHCSFTNAVSHVVLRRRVARLSPGPFSSLAEPSSRCLQKPLYPLTSASRRTPRESPLVLLLTQLLNSFFLCVFLLFCDILPHLLTLAAAHSKPLITDPQSPTLSCTCGDLSSSCS